METVRYWNSVIDMAEETGALVQDLDAQLMLRFKDGDTEAFDRLFVKHTRGIVNFAYRFVRNREIAEELAVFLRVYENAAGYRIQARFTSWLYKIATNVCLNEIRKPQFRVPHQSMHASLSDDGNDEDRKLEFGTAAAPDKIFEQKDLSRIIGQALSQIQRIAFILNKYQELSYSEVADVMDSSEKAVKSLIHRAKEALAERLRPFTKELLPK